MAGLTNLALDLAGSALKQEPVSAVPAARTLLADLRSELQDQLTSLRILASKRRLDFGEAFKRAAGGLLGSAFGAVAGLRNEPGPAALRNTSTLLCHLQAHYLGLCALSRVLSVVEVEDLAVLHWRRLQAFGDPLSIQLLQVNAYEATGETAFEPADLAARLGLQSGRNYPPGYRTST